jgi:hypothetical protein
MSLRCDILLADGMKKAPWVAPWVDNRLRAVIERWGFCEVLPDEIQHRHRSRCEEAADP